MNAPRIVKATLLVIIIALLCCCARSGVIGKGGEWLKGKTLSVKADLTNNGVVLAFQNQSAKEVNLLPFALTVWGKKNGRQELYLSTDGSGPDAKLKVKQSGGIGMTLQLSMPTSGPGFQFKLDPSPYGRVEWSPLGEGEATKVRVAIGPEGSKEQEVFTVSF
jgi:hypothetical protein